MDDRNESIADNERSPVSEAADEVDFGPSGTNEQDEERREQEGTTEANEPKSGPEGKPSVPPSRASHT